MKLLFNTRKDTSLGSDRIWIYDFYSRLKSDGYDVHLNQWDAYNTFDAVLFGKGTDTHELIRAREQNPRLIIGLVNPSDHARFFKRAGQSKKLALCDFFIVGSIEEQSYYMKYTRHCFLYPLVENLYSKKKEHHEKEKVVLTYHGNVEHLQQMGTELTDALNRVSQQNSMKFKLMYNREKLGTWNNTHLSKDIEVEHVQWNIHTIEDELLESDIGIVPSVRTLTEGYASKLYNRLFSKYYNSNDYLIRFKNTTNPGRALVFMQLGIPVVAGFAPSHFELIGNNKRGFLAHSSESWQVAIESLMASPSKREEIAGRAAAYIEKEYNLSEWSQCVYDDISMLYKHTKGA